MGKCSIAGCDGIAKSRGWCQAHYMRWLNTGDVGPAEVIRRQKGRICSVEGCNRKHTGRGFCEGHLRRFKATGDPGPAEFEPRRPKGDKCSIEGCDRLRYAKELCELHYRRVRDYGSLDVPEHPRWRSNPTYNAVHFRLRAERGRPSWHVCECGAQAQQWAYVRGDDQLLKIDDKGRPYSTDLSRYQAMCVTCHRRMDAEATRTQGCSVIGCEGGHKALGLCSKHYQAARK
jgi:hypothetical protein